MLIVLRGAGAGYEAEHVARLFFPGASLAGEVCPFEDETADLVAAIDHTVAQLVFVRRGGRLFWDMKTVDSAATVKQREYSLCRLLYGLLCARTGIRPPWGMMTGVRPVRIIHDMRAEGADEAAIEARFLETYDCTPERFATARAIADLQRPVLEANRPLDCSVYAGIPFCPTRCSYCSFVSRTVGDKATRALVEPYVDCLCRELAATGAAAKACGLRVRTLYIGGGTPTSLSAAQLRRLMRQMADCFPLDGIEEYTVEVGRPDCTDEEKLRVLKEYGATRISINPQTFSDAVLKNIGRRHTAQDILNCFRTARAVGHDNINMDLIAGLPGDTVEGFCRSLETAIALEPENITVHTLTLKRASNLVVEHRAAAYDDVAPPCSSRPRACCPPPGTAPITSTARKARCRTSKTSAGASPAVNACTTSISWRRSTPSSRPGRAAPPSWSRPACATARSSASSISNIPTNTSTALIPFSNARKE